MLSESIELYLRLIADCALFSLVVPPKADIDIFSVMISLPEYNIFVLIALASAGSLFGSIINYHLGGMATAIPMKKKSINKLLGEEGSEILKTANKLLTGKWQKEFILSLASIPLIGCAIPILLGFFKVKKKKIITSLFISHLIFYALLVAEAKGIINVNLGAIGEFIK